jgi:hypothetical protein
VPCAHAASARSGNEAKAIVYQFHEKQHFRDDEKTVGKALAAPLLAGRGSVAPARIEQCKWHHATIEVAGDDMRVWLDGAPSGHLKSPGIAHETKSWFHFTVTGPGVLFDDVKISRPC